MFPVALNLPKQGTSPERTGLPSAGRLSLEQAQVPVALTFTSARAWCQDSSLGVLICLSRALGASPNHFPGSNIKYW